MTHDVKWEDTAFKTALVLIATGERYWHFADDFITSAKRFFIPHDVILFTDAKHTFNVAHQIECPSLVYPEATLLRYHLFTSVDKLLERYENIFYSDVDMRFVSPVTEEEVLSKGITATQHPGYVGSAGTPETRKESLAYIGEPLRNYFCGGFNGGTSHAYLTMATNIRDAIDQDKEKNIVAVWWDESHLNRYLFFNPPAKILSPAFCYPDVPHDFYRDIWRHAGLGEITPKLLALEKGPS
jgi:hypothetical protein